MASHTTRDHDEIRCWAEDHDATPSVVSRSGGMLRFEFAANLPGELADVSWDDFFGVFDERGLELVYDDKPGSRFHKLVYSGNRGSQAGYAPAGTGENPAHPRPLCQQPHGRAGALAQSQATRDAHRNENPRARQVHLAPPPESRLVHRFRPT